MDSLSIKGGVPLHGEVTISGAKNAALPIMAATLLTAEPCVIRRVPDLSDVTFMGQILTSLGAKVKLSGDTLTVHAAKIKGVGDYDLIRKMRGSICILGPLIGRLRRASVSLPGGCVIGPRPIDLHLKGLSQLGARITIEGGYVRARAPRLAGGDVFLGGRAGPTVLGTANVMMAAVLADGVTIIESAACEPEVVDLACFLNAMGARIVGAGSPTVTITGVKELHGAEHDVIPDRIEAATFAIAAAATNGEVSLLGARPDHMHAVLDKLREAGVKVERCGPALKVKRGGRLKPVDITTLPYAGFPTDAQAQMMVLMALTPGIGIITERIFESRFMHVSELARLGADIGIEGPSAIVKGGRPMSGAPVMASDLRASAALVIAGLVARGTTLVKRIYHLDRGYERIDQKLKQLGARIERVEET
ncbi:MAG TPA: UDP-N-acetylglucosamine 1-carboxyvinyltransferase [Candidatus Angelobacter sp.]|nr:UDP-N-acetylglucosamine 1-carboxyvinyltransferase [Candidatus Angelobacter sp.]